MISSQELVYFVESARTGNLSRAAERLGITQPAITSALHRLEATVGTQLFHRSRSGVRLTKAGESLLQESQNLLSHWDRIARSVKQSNEEVMGTYVLGCHPSVALYSLPQTLPGLLSDFPNLRIELKHDLSRKITEQVIHGDVDLAIAVNPVRHPDLVIRSLCKDRVSFFTSSKANNINQIGSEQCVLLCNPELLQTQHLMRKTKKHFSRVVSSTSLESIAAIVDSGGGIAILPGRVAAHWKNLRALRELPSFEDEISLLFRVENRSLPAIKEIANRLEKGLR